MIRNETLLQMTVREPERQSIWAIRGSMRNAALEWRKNGRNARQWLNMAKLYRDKANWIQATIPPVP